MLDFRRLTLLAALALGIAACGTSSTTASHGASPTASLAPDATSPAAPSPAATSPAAAGPSGTPAAAGPSGNPAARQTDTEWGRIWDALPAGFPTFPGSTPSNEASTGPASAILVMDGNVAKAVATTAESKLKVAGYRTEALTGPLEDGSYTLAMTGSTPGCRVKVTAQPTGGLTTVTILYGAACPFS